jgi:hypothetical protein
MRSILLLIETKQGTKTYLLYHFLHANLCQVLGDLCQLQEDNFEG